MKSAWFLENDAHLKLSVKVNYIIHGSYSFVTVSYPPVLTATYWFHIIRVPIRSPASNHQFSLSSSGGFTPSRHLRPSSGREHTIVQLIQSGDDDYLMNETRRKLTTKRQSPSLFDKWHQIFYMPGRTDTAGHTKAFDCPVMGHWGKSRSVQFH